MLFALAFLAPLYGGAALLIREVAVRRGLGWPGVLLLSGAFGVLQAGLIDQSLFLGVDTGTELDDAFAPTLVEPWGISAAATTQWVGGNVVLSIGVPLALVSRWTSPEIRRRPWLRRRGLLFVCAAFLLVAGLIASDTDGSPSPSQLAIAIAVVVLLVGLALGRLGRPVERRPDGYPPSLRLLVAGGLLGQLVMDLAPPTWLGTAALWVVLVGALFVVVHLARAPHWTDRHVAALAAGAFLGRTAVGFVSPVVPGVDPVAKLAQSTLFGVVAVVLVLAVLRSRPAQVLRRIGELRANQSSPATGRTSGTKK